MSAAGLTPRAADIARAARDLLDAEGPEALTMRRLANAIGIQAPSLYKHFPDKESLEAAVIALAFEEQAEAFEAIVATTGSETQLWALAKAYRTNALAHPHLYRLMNDRPLRRDLLPEGLEAHTAGALLTAAGGQDRARAAWAFAHGMTMLELHGRFPPGADLDAVWEEGVRAFALAGPVTS